MRTKSRLGHDMSKYVEGYSEIAYGWRLALDGAHHVHLEHPSHSDVAVAIGHDRVLGVVVDYRDATKVPHHVRTVVKSLIQKSMYRAACMAG